MSNAVTAKPEFDWTGELEKTVVNSLVTTFGLDFLLFEDKRGGEVDTVLKAREYQKEIKKNGSSTIHVSNELASQLDSNGRNIDPYYKEIKNDKGEIQRVDAYHSDSKFRKKASDAQKDRQDGTLYDAYRNKTVKVDEKTELDHIISSSEIHNDAGRILADSDGISLSIDESNLASTHYYINNRKDDMSMEEFVYKEIPELINNKKQLISQNEERLKSMPEDTPEQRDKKRRVIDKIRKAKEHIKALEECDKEAMIEADKKSRAEYNKKINYEYYTSSKFFKSTAVAASQAGLKMGTRQALGLVFAEIWFELRERIPEIYRELKQKFTISKFLEKIAKTLKNIFERVKERFKDLLTAFKDGAIAGFFGSISTTVMNMFLVSEKMVVKLIREMLNSIGSAIKLIAFNPDNLNAKELFKGVLKILSAGLAVLLGTMLNAHLNSILVFPMGDLISAFLSALATGIMTLAFGYFIENGFSLKKIWDMLTSYKTKYEVMAEHMAEINAELDRYLLEWAKIEFNLNPNEIAEFADSLEACNSELERTVVLKKEITRRNIDLPFELGNEQSTRNWLASLAAK